MRKEDFAIAFSSIPSATGGIARLVCSRLRELGLDPAPIVLAAGLSIEDVQDRKHRLDARAQVKLLELAAKASGDDQIGFHLAKGFTMGEIGLVYYLMASAEQLADALRNAERYCAINNQGVRLRVSLERAFTIRFDYLNIDRLSDRQHAEFWLLGLVRICRTLTDGRLAPKQLKLRHLRSQTPADVRAYLGCEIDFGADQDAIVFPAPVAALPVVGADGYLHKLLLQYADQALADRASRPATVRSQVEDQIVHLLPQGKANATEIARRLGKSRRTLARDLSSEGTCFSDVLEAFRQALAKHYLGERGLPISEIAWLLGYSEISSFTHAFVRWTGSTPKAYRNSVG